MLDKFRLLFIVNINCPQPAINGTCFLSDNHDKTLRPQAKEEEEAEEGNIIVIHVQAAARTRSSGGYMHKYRRLAKLQSSPIASRSPQYCEESRKFRSNEYFPGDYKSAIRGGLCKVSEGIAVECG